MIVKNLSHKVIGIGNTYLSPDQTATIADKYAENKALQKMAAKGLILLVKDEGTKADAEEKTADEAAKKAASEAKRKADEDAAVAAAQKKAAEEAAKKAAAQEAAKKAGEGK